MGRRANKIEKHLSREQVEAFNERLVAMRGITLQKIADLADEFGVEISLMAAKTYRDTTLEQYLAELKAQSQMAQSIAEASKQGLTMTDAAASVLSSKLLNSLVTSGELEVEEMNEFSLALSRLRTGDQRARLLEVKLRDAELKVAAAEAAEDERKRRAAQLKATLDKAGDKMSAEDVRAAALAAVDEILLGKTH